MKGIVCATHFKGLKFPTKIDIWMFSNYVIKVKIRISVWHFKQRQTASWPMCFSKSRPVLCWSEGQRVRSTILPQTRKFPCDVWESKTVTGLLGNDILCVRKWLIKHNVRTWLDICAYYPWPASTSESEWKKKDRLQCKVKAAEFLPLPHFQASSNKYVSQYFTGIEA